MVDGLIEELGGNRRYSGRAWPFGDTSGVPWRPFREYLAAFAERLRVDLGEELGLAADALRDVQLETRELRPIVTAIEERPGCALLVFGCGNDSPFWEKVNRGGTTAFLEDDPEWVADARAELTTATVHSVRYGTRLADWRSLLDRPSELVMDLPADVASRRWDVILVDGPAGYNDARPGRMKSIYAASRLVAPGGRVFVHDCERPAEQAFASRYLSDDRVFVEVKGRALLRGYAF
jgi:glucuronoxylan 4-O-methyltransferase